MFMNTPLTVLDLEPFWAHIAAHNEQPQQP